MTWKFRIRISGESLKDRRNTGFEGFDTICEVGSLLEQSYIMHLACRESDIPLKPGGTSSGGFKRGTIIWKVHDRYLHFALRCKKGKRIYRVCRSQP